jgi:hypothetical protein
MTKPKIIYNPATIAECGGPCEQGPEYCDCGTLRINCPDASVDDHPLTDEMCEVIATGNQWSGDIGDVVFRHGDMRAAADWQLGQVEKSVERRIKVLRQSGYVFAADAIEDFFQGLMQNMRPQENNS